MSTPRISVDTDNLGVVFTLATGEKMSVRFTDRLDIQGYGIHVDGTNRVFVQPGANNSVSITTERGILELEDRIKEAIIARRAGA